VILDMNILKVRLTQVRMAVRSRQCASIDIDMDMYCNMLQIIFFYVMIFFYIVDAVT